jgi:DNA-binding beta-propeller fold protein YncE
MMLMNSGKVKAHVPFVVATGSIVIMAALAATVVLCTATGGDRIPAGRSLYVLDTNDGGAKGQVMLIDTSTGQVTKTYNTGFHPDMALSPDGSRLYIASIRDTANSPHSVLETYDTASGALIRSVENPDSFQTTVQIYGSTMSIAPSGRYIYTLKLHNTKGLVDEYITAFDTQHNRFLNDHASLNTECDFIMLPTSQDLTLDVACANSAGLRELTLGDATEPVEDKLSPIKTTQARAKWGAVFLQPGEQNVAFVSTSGSAFALDRVSAAVQHLGMTSESGPWIQRGLMPENQTAVYFSTERVQRPYPNRHDTIVAADPMTLALRGTLSATQPFFSIELSRDGSSLYMVNPEQASITVVDLGSFREVRRLAPIGHTPTIAIAAP